MEENNPIRRPHVKVPKNREAAAEMVIIIVVFAVITGSGTKNREAAVEMTIIIIVVCGITTGSGTKTEQMQ